MLNFTHKNTGLSPYFTKFYIYLELNQNMHMNRKRKEDTAVNPSINFFNILYNKYIKILLFILLIKSILLLML